MSSCDDVIDKTRTPDDTIDYRNPSVYAPNSRRVSELQLPPGVSPSSLVCYASIDGQD